MLSIVLFTNFVIEAATNGVFRNNDGIMDEIKAPATRLPLSLLRHCRDLYEDVAKAASFTESTDSLMRSLLRKTCQSGKSAYDDKGLPRMVLALETADAFAHFINADTNIIQAILLCDFAGEAISHEEIQTSFGDDVAEMLKGIETVAQFSAKRNLHNQDNFRGLMLSLADDIRVIIIMIVRDLVLMRNINLHPDTEWVSNMAFEANVLYAQLAHRLGLYKIKGELEDLSLKYTNREIYKQIANKLNETKRSRDAYIEKFIAPVKKKLEDAGLTFSIKGRTKSISSIWAKMRKQKVDLDRIYDLFAIRVIIDTPPEKEKSDCWLAYSILTDMYTPNPSRMRDWISIPKSNGYESLHATVMGPDSKWVEVQFRTKRMDLVAEKGLAAHWRYKGVKSDSTDQWMNNIRDILEAGEEDPMQLMKDIRMDIYTKEVYAFTPKGDLFKLPAGATVLDFAFYIHSNVGAHCTGGVVNGRHRKISHVIQSGDTVEILTSATQTPKSDWLNIVVSSKSRSKIRQKLHEELQARADLGKEELMRRAKNRKIELDESLLMKLIKKEGYKYVNEFFADIADNKVDAGKIISTYQASLMPEENTERTTAQDFELIRDDNESTSDVLTIGEKSIKGLSYKFAKCCNPVYGDKVFGFISSDGVVKIHKTDCPNAQNIRSRYPYRLIRVTWSGKGGSELPVQLRILGQDDIGIIANITSIISKETKATLRNIKVDSDDGLFQGYLTIGVTDNAVLTSVIRKIKGVKGVKEVERI